MADWEGIVIGFWASSAGRNDPGVLEFAVSEVTDVTFQPDQHIPPDNNLVASFVVAEAAVVAAIHADGRYHFFWARPVEGSSGQERLPGDVMPEAEVLEFRDFLTANWGWTTAQIANWLDMTAGEVLDWMTTHTRQQSLDKFLLKWREFTKS